MKKLCQTFENAVFWTSLTAATAATTAAVLFTAGAIMVPGAAVPAGVNAFCAAGVAAMCGNIAWTLAGPR